MCVGLFPCSPIFGALMESFVWSGQFETGLKEVDEQHHGLVDIINTIGTKLTGNAITDLDLETLLGQLMHYAHQHFEDEEKLMRERGVDSRHYQAHVTEHEVFVNDVLLFASRSTDREETINKARTLHDYLVHWLAYHILVLDKNMARQLAAIAKGVPSADAWAAEEHAADASTEPLLKALKGLFALVSERNRELAVLNQNLEGIVASRTRELLKANADLEVLALTDVLTELPNRRQAMRQLQALWQEASSRKEPLGCMLIDADGFKEVNDTFGHDAGDLVLKRLATELRDNVRSDDIVCRLGGDEFLIICPNTPLMGLSQMAESLRSFIATLRVEVGEDGFWPGSISVGVAVRTMEMRSVDQLLKAADDGVYMAKNAGRNCVRTRQNFYGA